MRWCALLAGVLLTLAAQPTSTPTAATSSSGGIGSITPDTWITVGVSLVVALIGVWFGLYQMRRSEKLQKEREKRAAEEQQQQRKEQDDEAARLAMARATTTAQRVQAYRTLLHSDPRIAKLQILDMSQPLEVANVFVRVRLHKEKTSYDLPSRLAEAQMRHDPNELFLASRHYLEDRASAAIDPDEALRQYTRCIFVGDPGAGKSTLLKYLTLKCADQQLSNLSDLPIHVELNAFASAGAHDLLGFAATTWNDRYRFPAADARAYMDQALKDGHALLLLDALDETVLGTTNEEADASYKQASDAIMQVAARYPQAPIVVSARKAAYAQRARLVGFTELEVLDFRQEECEQFIDNWFACAPHTSQYASADDLKSRLANNARLQALAANPLLLSLIVIVYQDQLDLPDRRAELYKQCVDVLLHKWDTSRDIRRRRAFKPEQKQHLLEEVAWYFHTQGQRYLQESELLDVIADFLPAIDLPREQAARVLDEIAAENGLLKEQARHWYGFLHLTLQEYCAAVYASDHNKLDVLLTHVGDPWWEEVLLLYAGHIPDASPLLQRLIGQNDAPFQHDDLFSTNLLLAGRCLAARPTVRTSFLRETIIATLFQTLLHTPYQLCQQHIAETLAEIGGSAINDRLLQLLSNEQLDSYVRGNIARTIGNLGDKSVVPTLLSLLSDEQLDRYVRKAIADAIGNLGDKSVVPLLLSLLSDEQLDRYVREAIADAIGKLSDKSVVPVLLPLLSDEQLDRYVRGAIADAIGNLGDKSVVPLLLSLLSDEQLDRYVRKAIADAIGKLSDKSVVPVLLALLNNEQLNNIVRRDIARAIGSLSDKSVVPVLLSLLSDEQLDRYVRGDIARAIGNLGDKSVVPLLLPLLSDEQLDRHVRVAIAGAIGNLGDKSVVPVLLALLSDEQLDISLRRDIAGAIGNLGDKSVMPVLLALLNNEQLDISLRSAIARAICNLGDKSVVPVLLALLNNEQFGSYMRGEIAQAIGKLGDKSVVPVLLALLNNEQLDNIVRAAIAEAIGKLADDGTAIHTLVSFLHVSDIQNDAYSSLWTISRRMRVRIMVTQDAVGQQVEVTPL